jgi:hypothetical protein
MLTTGRRYCGPNGWSQLERMLSVRSVSSSLVGGTCSTELGAARTIEEAVKTASVLHSLILSFDGGSLVDWEEVDWAQVNPDGAESGCDWERGVGVSEDVDAAATAHYEASREAERQSLIDRPTTLAHLSQTENYAPQPSGTAQKSVVRFGSPDYNKLQNAVIVHFIQHYKKGLLCWPRGASKRQRSLLRSLSGWLMPRQFV